MFEKIFFSIQAAYVERSRRSGLLLQSLILIGIISLFSITGKAQVIASGAENFPQQIGIGASQLQSFGSVIEGGVSSIEGTIIQIAGRIRIDASSATISSLSSPFGQSIPLSAIKIGSSITAVVAVPADEGSPLDAKFIFLKLETEGLLNGVLQNVDATDRVITLLNQKILVTDKTLFIKVVGQTVKGVSKFERLKTGFPTTVGVFFDGEKLIASQITQIKVKDE